MRFADDFLAAFQHRADAELFLADLRERFAGFGANLLVAGPRFLASGDPAAAYRAIAVAERVR